MMIPDDIGMVAFHGDAELKRTLLERLEWYEAQGDAELKGALLQEEWNRKAQHGLVLNPYPKIVQAADIAGLRISGGVSTLYALGIVNRSRLGLVGERVYLIQTSDEDAFNKRTGVPQILMSILNAVSKGLPPERETSWLRQFWAAIPVGASLWQAPMRLILWALSNPSHGILGLNDAAGQAGEDDRGIKAVRDFLAMYEHWSAGNKAEPPDWFSFVSPAEADVKNSRRQDDDGKYVYDLPASVRFCLRAAAGAARAASVEEAVVTPLPKGTTKIQILSDTTDAPGSAIDQAGLYASEKSTASSGWYEACASVLLHILADSPVLDRPRE